MDKSKVNLVILHGKMILSLYPRLIGSSVARRIIAVIIVIAGLFFVVFPFVLKPEVQELEGKGRHYREGSDIKSK